jgi:hypothetical protein
LETQRQQQTQKEAPSKSRQAEIAGRLRIEQPNLDELNENLNALERQLEPAQPNCLISQEVVMSIHRSSQLARNRYRVGAAIRENSRN